MTGHTMAGDWEALAQALRAAAADLRSHLARRLRRAADRVDPHTGPRLMSAVSGFTLEKGLGVVFRDDGRGCPLWYMAQDYDRAHDEAGDLDAAHAWLPGHRLTEPGQWHRPRVITDDVELPDPGELDYQLLPPRLRRRHA